MSKTAKIFDLNNLLYRVFHTSSPTYNANGLRNDVIKRVYRELSDVRNSLVGADEIFIVSDANGSTFRHDLTPTYKSNKKGMPDDLKIQEGPILELLSAGGFKLFTKPGYEADDVMGMLANELTSRGFTRIEINSNDKDILQLVNEEIRVFNPSNKILYDRDAVIGKFGVPPELIPDMLAIIGDKSDGIAGVDGVGEKSAAKWINEFGSAMAVFENKGLIKGRGSKALQASYLDIELNLKLTNIVSDPGFLSPEEIKTISHADEADNFNDLLDEYEVYQSSVSTAPITKQAEPSPAEEKNSDSQLSFF